MDHDLHPGTIINETYEVLSKKSGGMGIVYICIHRAAKRKIVFKTIKREFLSDAKAFQRFFQEAQLWIELGYHYSIVSAEHALVLNEQPFIILEYGGAFNLREFVNYVGHLSLRESVTIAVDVLDGLDYAQRKMPSLVHADLKPENIIIDRRYGLKVSITEVQDFFEKHRHEYLSLTDDQARLELAQKELGGEQEIVIHAKVTDFGLAMLAKDLLAQKSSPFGTPPYMSPEQCRGDKVDLRSDIYSFGIILYEMLCGKWPYHAKTAEEFFDAHVAQEPMLLSGQMDTRSNQLNRIVMRCLEKDPDARYQDFATIQKDILSLDIIRRDAPIDVSTLRGSLRDETDHLISKGITLITFGRLEDGIDQIERAISITPQATAKLSTVAEILNRKGYYKLGLKYASLVLDAVPDDQHALVMQGLALAHLGRPEEAIDCFNRVLEMNPEDAQTWTNKGAVYCDELHRADLALQCFDRAIDIDSKLPQAWASRGNALAFLDRRDEALKSWRKALALDPQDIGVLLSMGGFLNDKWGEHQEALSIFDEAIAINPNVSEVWGSRGVALLCLNRLDAALKSFERASALDPSNVGFISGIGDVLARSERYADAIERYTIVLKENPTNLAVLANAGICEMNLGQFGKAIHYFEKALQVEPNNGRLQELVDYCRQHR
jgi:serine/threonine protein kinase/Tfp pilus assembly protein PilF